MNEKTPLEWIEMKIMTGTRNSLGPRLVLAGFGTLYGIALN
jgi:hypothetical protein